jgi:UDPglucose--hexose-1-phosphate uridylyltransferase
MSQLRWDPLLREWVTYAPQRQERPILPPAEWCPLCPTRAEGFPSEIPRAQYHIAVFENRFPSYTPGAPPPAEVGTPLAPTAPGQGVCEVLAYSQRHDSTLAALGERRIRELVEVWADRYRRLGALEHIKYVFIFENKGEAVGVTLHHPHGQIYGYPFIPPRPAQELRSAREYRETHVGGCLHCALLADERADGRRIVAEGEHFAAFVPFFARYPYETHLYAKRCAPSLVDLTHAERDDLARVLQHVLAAYDALWDLSLPYMMAMHQAPTTEESYVGIAHFHIEFYPLHRTREKLKYLAGSESGAGAFIVDMLPEAMSAHLRAARQGLPPAASRASAGSQRGTTSGGTAAAG